MSGVSVLSDASGSRSPVEIIESLDSFAAWQRFIAIAPALFDQASFPARKQHILREGLIEPLTRTQVTGADVEPGSSSREGLVYRGCNSRARAVLLLIERFLSENGLFDPRIYAAEALTPFALRLRGLYPRFIGSEFTLDEESRERMYPIPFEDLQNLSLKSDSFDVVTTNEVLEHVPSIDLALSELCRVLKPGGWHFGTVPFAFMSEQSTRRAFVSDAGKLIHILPPEYHGDPMSENGVLVFEIPGWDILDRARRAGFSTAEMRYVSFDLYGVLDDDIGGVLVLCLQK